MPKWSIHSTGMTTIKIQVYLMPSTHPMPGTFNTRTGYNETIPNIFLRFVREYQTCAVGVLISRLF